MRKDASFGFAHFLTMIPLIVGKACKWFMETKYEITTYWSTTESLILRVLSWCNISGMEFFLIQTELHRTRHLATMSSDRIPQAIFLEVSVSWIFRNHKDNLKANLSYCTTSYKLCITIFIIYTTPKPWGTTHSFTVKKTLFSCWDHIAPAFVSLKWFPICFWTHFKALALTFKSPVPYTFGFNWCYYVFYNVLLIISSFSGPV